MAETWHYSAIPEKAHYYTNHSLCFVQMNKAMSWFGTIASIVGSFAVAGHLFLLGYTAFLFGAVALVSVFIRDKNWPQITLQFFFLIANLIGLYNAVV